MKRLLLILPLALTVVSAASAKDFQPGDLRLCGHGACVAITNGPALSDLSRLYYTGAKAPRIAAAPKLGASVLQLRFTNGYVSGVVSGARFLSFGVNLDRLRARVWYAMPARAAAELARLAKRLRPYTLTPATLGRSR